MSSLKHNLGKLWAWAVARTWLIVWSLGLLHLVFYALAQTIWSRVDEAQHFHYMQYVAENGVLPIAGQTFISREVIDVSLAVDQWGWNPPRSVPAPPNLDPRDWQTVPSELQGGWRWNWIIENLWYFNYEAMQPPLYYFLGAVVYRLLGVGPFLHIYVLRVLSAIIASFTVLLAYYTMKEAFPQNRTLVLGVSFTIALMPGFVLNLSQITNDSLATTLSTVCFYLLVRQVVRSCQGGEFSSSLSGSSQLSGAHEREGEPQLAVPLAAEHAPMSVKPWTAVGVVIGLSLLTKLTTLYLIPVALAALVLASHRAALRVSLSRILKPGVAIVAIPFLILLPWLLRNRFVYGDFTGSAVASDLLGAIFPPVRPDSVDAFLSYVNGSLEHLAHTFWFGEPFSPWAHWEIPYSIILALSYISLFGMATYFWRLSRKRGRGELSVVLLMAVTVTFHIFEILIGPAFGGLGVVGRYLYPSVVPAVGLIWLGLLSMARDEARRPILAVVIGGLITLGLLNLVTYVQTNY